MEVILEWDTEGFPVGAWGDSGAVGGLGRHCQGGRLSRGRAEAPGQQVLHQQLLCESGLVRGPGWALGGLGLGGA